MMSSGLASWQSTNRYRKEGDIVYGVYQGCGFTVSEEDGGKLFIFMLSARDEAAFNDFENSLASLGGVLGDGQVGDVESYLAVFFDESRGEVPASAMDKILEFTASRARQCGFRVPNVCVKCGARATKRSFVDNMVQPLCADCSAQNKQNRRSAEAPAAPAPAPIQEPVPQPYGGYSDSRSVPQDDEYARQYAPIIPDSSKYDDSYDEYAGMTSQYSDYNSHSDEYSDGYSNDSYSDAPSQISFNDSDEDDYHSVMGNDSDYEASDTEIGGNMSMGILGALAGSFVGIIPYLIVSVVAHFPMGALCFPAGMLAIVLYTKLGGIRSKGMGMGICMSLSSIISVITMFFAMTLSYMNETRDFFGAISYLFSDQAALFGFNIVFAILGAVLGSCLMIGAMDKYTDNIDNMYNGESNTHADSSEFGSENNF